MSVTEKLRNSYYMAGVEFTNLNIPDRALLGVTTGAIIFDLGPWNEWLTGAGSSFVNQELESAQNTREIVQSSAITAAAGATIMAAEQFTVGSLTAVSLRRFPDTAKIYNEGVNQDNKTSLNGSIATTVLLGTSAAVTMKHVRDSDRTLREDIAFVAKGSPLVGAYVFGVVGIAGAGINTLKSYGQEETANTLENAFMNPLTYLGVFGLYKASEAVVKKFKQRKFS